MHFVSILSVSVPYAFCSTQTPLRGRCEHVNCEKNARKERERRQRKTRGIISRIDAYFSCIDCLAFAPLRGISHSLFLLSSNLLHSRPARCGRRDGNCLGKFVHFRSLSFLHESPRATPRRRRLREWATADGRSPIHSISFVMQRDKRMIKKDIQHHRNGAL